MAGCSSGSGGTCYFLERIGIMDQIQEFSFSFFSDSAALVIMLLLYSGVWVSLCSFFPHLSISSWYIFISWPGKVLNGAFSGTLICFTIVEVGDICNQKPSPLLDSFTAMWRRWLFNSFEFYYNFKSPQFTALSFHHVISGCMSQARGNTRTSIRCGENKAFSPNLKP